MTTSFTATTAGVSGTGGLIGRAAQPTTRLIDSWFPCPEVDVAVGTPGLKRSQVVRPSS